MSIFLETHRVGVRAGATSILSNVSIGFAEGEVTALLGHNGSGKSTLLKVLARQIPPSSGRVTLKGRDFSRTGARDFARTLGYLPQHPAGTDGLTVGELVALGRYPWRGPLGRYNRDDYQAIEEAIADTEMTAFSQRSVDTLSGGERQRAWIAMLLAQRTRCLLLDEPISALDVRHQVETLRLVQRLARERELTVIMVLHDVDLAARFCDRLVALRRGPRGGELIADGSPASIMSGETLHDIYSIPMGVVEPAPGQWISFVR